MNKKESLYENDFSNFEEDDECIFRMNLEEDIEVVVVFIDNIIILTMFKTNELFINEAFNDLNDMYTFIENELDLDFGFERL